jgi:hypothetical protein
MIPTLVHITTSSWRSSRACSGISAWSAARCRGADGSIDGGGVLAS